MCFIFPTNSNLIHFEVSDNLDNSWQICSVSVLMLLKPDFNKSLTVDLTHH